MPALSPTGKSNTSIYINAVFLPVYFILLKVLFLKTSMSYHVVSSYAKAFTSE